MIAKFALATALVAGAALSAHAGPAPEPCKHPMPKVQPPYAPQPTGGVDSVFTENFDSYTVGGGVVGQNGWQLWDNSGFAFDGVVVNTHASSPPNSLQAIPETDIVRVFNITSGKWEFKIKTYVPTGMTGNAYVIMLNTFSAPYVGGGSWSLQLEHNPTLQYVQSQWGNEIAPLVFDQWVEIRAEIDLDAPPNGLLNVWYNNQQFVFNRPWHGNTSPTGSGAVRIQCLDLYSPAAGFKWDDISLTEMASGCYPNCDQSTTQPILNIDDFTCFINAFAAAQSLPQAQQITHYSNCDGSTIAPVLNIDDFTCFINAFAQGCP